MDLMLTAPTVGIEPLHQAAEIAMWKPPPGHDTMTIMQSQFVNLKAYNVFAMGTGLWAPTALPVSSPVGSARPPGSVPTGSVVDALAQERIKILAAKYVTGGKDKEILARLAILNQRMLRQVPTVTEGQVAFLERAQETLAELGARSAERAQRLGLPT